MIKINVHMHRNDAVHENFIRNECEHAICSVFLPFAILSLCTHNYLLLFFLCVCMCGICGHTPESGVRWKSFRFLTVYLGKSIDFGFHFYNSIWNWKAAKYYWQRSILGRLSGNWHWFSYGASETSLRVQLKSECGHTHTKKLSIFSSEKLAWFVDETSVFSSSIRSVAYTSHHLRVLSIVTVLAASARMVFGDWNALFLSICIFSARLPPLKHMCSFLLYFPSHVLNTILSNHSVPLTTTRIHKFPLSHTHTKMELLLDNSSHFAFSFIHR